MLFSLDIIQLGNCYYKNVILSVGEESYVYVMIQKSFFQDYVFSIQLDVILLQQKSEH